MGFFQLVPLQIQTCLLLLQDYSIPSTVFKLKHYSSVHFEKLSKDILRKDILQLTMLFCSLLLL